MHDDASNVQQGVLKLVDLDVADSTPWAARPMAEWRERGYVPDSDDEDDVGSCSGPTAVNSRNAQAEAITSRGSQLGVDIDKVTCLAEAEHIGVTITSRKYDALSQEVENISARERTNIEDEELHQPRSFGNPTTRAPDQERHLSYASQAELAETIEANDERPAASVGDQLQAELEHGLQTVKEILENACMQSRPNSINRNQTSSPLSSIRSFSDDGEIAERAGDNRPVPVQANQLTAEELMKRGHQNDSPPRYPGRDLRRRNPIQLHPYALEDARYKRELKARGLKPVRLVPGSSGMHRDQTSDDTQDEDVFSSSPMDDSAEAESIGYLESTLHSQNAPLPEVNRAAPFSRPLTLFNDNEELPELSAILEADILPLHAKKRRKIVNESLMEVSHFGHEDFHIPELPPADLDRNGHENMEIDMFEMPPSPPRSSSSNISNTLTMPRKVSGQKERMTPRGIPTPVASSLTKAPPEPGIETEYLSDSSEGSELDHSPQAGSSPLPANMRQGKGIERIQRRIKGVLPASWLTLDLDKQVTKNRPRKPSGSSPVKQPGAKGVARRLKSSRLRLSLAEDQDIPVIDISDDSSSETGPLNSAKTTSAWASTLFEDDDFGTTFLDDVAEDGSIDLMAPPLPRSGKRARIAAERQTTLIETFKTTGIAQLGHSMMRKTSHKRKKQPMPTVNDQCSRENTHRRSGAISGQCNILDAPALAQSRVDDQPQFIRIAARRARTQRDTGHSTQSHKNMLLASEADRQDVKSTLLSRQWGRVRFRENKLSIPGRNLTQRPLLDYELLVQPPILDLPKTSTKKISSATHASENIISLKNSSASTIRRILLPQVGRLASTNIDDSLIAQKMSDARVERSQHINLPRKLFSHYQNRSGKGRLTSSLAQVKASRPGQLEATQCRASVSDLVTVEYPTFSSITSASTPRVVSQTEPQRPPGAKTFTRKVSAAGQLVRKRVPQNRDNQPQSSTIVGDRTALIPRKGEMMDLRVGTFFRDLTFVGCDDLVKNIRKARESGFDSIDCANLVRLLRTYYGNNNMDEVAAKRGNNTREFLEDYTQHGRIQLPTNNDMGFDAFLKLIITTGIQKASSGEKTSSLSNFIFSLVPNSGQLLRKDQDHDSWALRPLQNRHDLYSALYFISPLETKIRLLPQIQSLVDLRESHISACTISLNTLIRLARFQISTDEDPLVLQHFGKWIQEIIKKMEEQFDAARLEAFSQVRGTVSRQDALQRIMRFNQDKIQNFLTSVLCAWSDCLRDCRTPDQAKYLLFGADLGAVLDLCNRTIALDSTDGRDGHHTVAFRDDVIVVMVSSLTSYITSWLPRSENMKDLVDDLHSPLKSLLSSQLGRYEQCSDEVLKLFTYCWHALAKVSVDHGIRSWDNYFSLGGRDAWQSFDDTWHKRQYEVYFATLFIESNEDAWRDWQYPMLQLWIASLLVPEAYFKYQAGLTMQIMRYGAPYNPLLFHLPLVIYEDEVLIEIELDELIVARTALVLALLRNMNRSTTRPDSQDSFFGPTEDDCSEILKIMMGVMRQYLRELEGDPAEQSIYADFVGRVLSEMRTYTIHLEPVPDNFEYMPDKYLPLAPGTVRSKLSLYRQQMMESEMEKHMIVFLHNAAERAAITGQQEAFEKQLVDVFLDMTPESLEDAQGYAADARFRTLFFQDVFPAYLDRLFYGSGFIITRPILGSILSVYQGIRFRFGFWTPEFLEPFLTATLSLLSTMKTTLGGSITSPEHILSDPNQLCAYGLLCSIMCEILCRSQEMEDSFGTFGALSDIWEYFLFFYKYTLRVAFRPPRTLPEELPDEDGQTTLLQPKLSATDDAMLAYSRRELGDILDFKWVPGYGGTWFVNRAGGRKEQVHAAVVGSWEQEMLSMELAAEKYVRVFAGLWNAQY